jgi:arginyl-tRNA synthetase
MADPLVTLAERLTPVVSDLAGAPTDPVVRPSDRADAQVNAALALAKSLGRNPREVAQAIVDADVLDGVCSAIEIAGPGFVNVTFDDAFLAAEVARVAADDDLLGVRRPPAARTIVIDYSAPNVAKEMHVGHLRSTVIGDSLARLAAFLGHRVVRENHVGDWGTPFGMLIEHLLDLGEDEAASELSVGELDGFYKAARRKFDGDDSFKERARQRVVMLQQGDAETLRLWRILVAESTRYFDAVYQRLGVLLTSDDLMGESAYNHLLADVVRRLDDAGLLVESEGAEVVFPPGFTNREGHPLPLIIRKGDGGYNYATTDLACLIDRFERLGADDLWYVVGAPQAQHLQMVFAVARQAGWLAPPRHAEHVAFGSVLGSDRKMLKSREGDTVKLAALLDEAVERAAAAVAEKNPSLSDDERAAVARIVGIGAVKYADLSTDRIKDYVFDWDRMLSFDGNTAPYLQYAHARICSIFRRSGIDRASVRSVEPLLGTPQERALALRLLAFDSAVWDTVERASPHRLCGYLYDLACDFTAFYEHCPVLKAADDGVRTSRLALCDLTARILERGLGLLGITAPEQM